MATSSRANVSPATRISGKPATCASGTSHMSSPALNARRCPCCTSWPNFTSTSGTRSASGSPRPSACPPAMTTLGVRAVGQELAAFCGLRIGLGSDVAALNGWKHQDRPHTTVTSDAENETSGRDAKQAGVSRPGANSAQRPRFERMADRATLEHTRPRVTLHSHAELCVQAADVPRARARGALQAGSR